MVKSRLDSQCSVSSPRTHFLEFSTNPLFLSRSFPRMRFVALGDLWRHNTKVNSEPIIRRTARVLLADELDRVLLFQGQDPSDPSSIYWCPVGGGIEPSESPEDAARREVREETGLIDFDLGSHVWNRQDKYSFNGQDYFVSEAWFFSRVSAFEIDTTALFGLERVSFVQYRWWTQGELDATTEIMTPRQLAPLFKDLIVNGAPNVPLELAFRLTSFTIDSVNATITCPTCGHQASETIPQDACLFFYKCLGCSTVMKPLEGDCCVFCSYSESDCPSRQR